MVLHYALLLIHLYPLIRLCAERFWSKMTTKYKLEMTKTIIIQFTTFYLLFIATYQQLKK